MIWLLLIFSTPAAHAQVILGTLNVCTDNLDVSALYDKALRPQNQYTLTYLGYEEIQANSQMTLKFDSVVSVKLLEPRTVRILKSADNNQFSVRFTEKTSYLRVQVYGPNPGFTIPYIRSILLNDVELCKQPKTGYLDYAIESPVRTIIPRPVVDEGIELEDDGRVPAPPTPTRGKPVDRPVEYVPVCGRRQVVHTALIVLGQPTQPGDWPWHAAILHFDGQSLGYRCGGTLLSKTLVLTAAHCATIGSNPIVPNAVSVVLGKYNLIGGDIAAQERGVYEVIVHPDFDVITLNNDIALLRLRSEAAFNDYVQPACVWNAALRTEDLFGTVVGWGFNHQDTLSRTLQQITVPIVSELTCLKSDPIFFHRKLNTNKFCAGFANGTSVCNGDSGGGFMIFASGAWHVRGIVSLAASRSDAKICDPFQYTLFTDVEMYRDWVMGYLN